MRKFGRKGLLSTLPTGYIQGQTRIDLLTGQNPNSDHIDPCRNLKVSLKVSVDIPEGFTDDPERGDEPLLLLVLEWDGAGDSRRKDLPSRNHRSHTSSDPTVEARYETSPPSTVPVRTRDVTLTTAPRRST